jgi:hypothetical protein
VRPGTAAAAAALAGCVCLVAREARAVSPVLWTVETLEEFERGKPDGVALGATGELTLGPAISALNVPPLEQSSEPFLWCLAADGKGTVYAGGGKSGTIYRVPKGGVGSVYYETGDLAVHALVVDRDVLYAATLPEGRIVRVTGESKGETWYQPEDRYVWGLALGPKGELYAATGERGIVYKITGQGKAEVFFDSEEFHIVSLAIDAQGNLLAGSDGKGLLYRITPQGKATVLYDAPLREIAALAVDAKGAVYAAAIGAESEPPPLPLILPNPVLGREAAPPGLPGQPPLQVPGISEEPTPRVTVTTLGGTVVASSPARSEVYRIDPDGTVVSVWSSPTELAYALVIDAAGRPVIGTGEPARVRVLTAPRQSVLLAKLPPSQVTALLPSGRQLIAATSNIGRLYLLDPAQADSGSYLSEAQDALTTARWGRIAWRAAVPSGSKVEIATRTGNSATPDATWSDWSQVYANADGSAITSSAARFLQWRARLQRQGKGNGDGPTLQSVSVAYLQANLPPQAKRLTLLPPGVVRERSTPSADVDPESLAYTGVRGGPLSAGRADSGASDLKKLYARGQRAFEWEADDPNGDPLSYDLWFRGEGETAWKPLARGLRDAYFAFDSMSLPDGLYRVRLDVSDAPGNAADQAKSASLQSETFLVDNTAPVVQVTARKAAKGGTTLEINATDGFGPLSRAEASLDAARWTPLSPVDGVGDSRTESYTLPLERLRPGEHTAIVRVFDLLGNVGSGKATFTTE